jgi:polyferredoxin
MGIDIRDGLQMECIACGLCIDACDDIMKKLELPTGLIRYDTERRMDQKACGIKPKNFRILRPRTLYYSVVLIAVSSLMLYTLINRPLLELNVIHDRNPLFVILSDGQIRNGYEIKILNKSHQDNYYSLNVLGLKNAKLDIQSAGTDISQGLFVPADSVGNFKVFVQAAITPQEPKDIIFKVINKSNNNNNSKHETIFISIK